MAEKESLKAYECKDSVSKHACAKVAGSGVRWCKRASVKAARGAIALARGEAFVTANVSCLGSKGVRVARRRTLFCTTVYSPSQGEVLDFGKIYELVTR